MSRLLTPDEWKQAYGMIDEHLCDVDCGKFCAPLNNGVPVCCDDEHAVPGMYREELHALDNPKSWKIARGPTYTKIREEIKEDGMVCRLCSLAKEGGCIREVRPMVCHTFPLMPVVTKQGHFIGFRYHQEFEMKCWVISNVHRIRHEYILGSKAAHDFIFNIDPDQKDGYRQATMYALRQHRRVGAIMLFIDFEKRYKGIRPSGEIIDIPFDRLPKFGPYASPEAYKEETGGVEMPNL